MAQKFKRNDRVVLASDEKYHGFIYGTVPRYVATDGDYYYVQWDKGDKYQYSEDMLIPETKKESK
jgi:hypothetical protein